MNYDDEEVNPFKKLQRKAEKEQHKDTSFMNIKVSQGDILLPVDDYAITLLQKFGSNS